MELKVHFCSKRLVKVEKQPCFGNGRAQKWVISLQDFQMQEQVSYVYLPKR